MGSRTTNIKLRHMSRIKLKWFALLLVQLLLIVNDVKCEISVNKADNTTVETVTNSSTNYFNQNNNNTDTEQQHLQNVESIMEVVTMRMQSNTSTTASIEASAIKEGMNGDGDDDDRNVDRATSASNLEDYGSVINFAFLCFFVSSFCFFSFLFNFLTLFISSSSLLPSIVVLSLVD